MASAARTARAASSSCDRYRPKTAIAASPMNFSTTPPSASTAAADGREVAAHDLLQVLGVQPLGQRGGVDEVGEEDGDQLALLADRGGQEPVALVDQRRQGGLDHLVAQDLPLALERGDRLLQGGQLPGMGREIAHRRSPPGRSAIACPLSPRVRRTLPPSPPQEEPFVVRTASRRQVRFRPQVGQAPGPWTARTFSATAICWSRVARSARGA